MPTLSSLYFCSVILSLRSGEKKRFYGKIIRKNGWNYFIANSPRQSFGPGTVVIWFRLTQENKD